MPGIRVFSWRNDMRMTPMMASAALFALAALPATAVAGGLFDADVKLGGSNLASVDVGANVGGIHGDVDAKVGSTATATAGLGTTTGTTVKTSLGSLRNATVRAEALGVVHARARLLSQKQLLKLCITVGARAAAEHRGATNSRSLMPGSTHCRRSSWRAPVWRWVGAAGRPPGPAAAVPAVAPVAGLPAVPAQAWRPPGLQVRKAAAETTIRASPAAAFSPARRATRQAS